MKKQALAMCLFVAISANAAMAQEKLAGKNYDEAKEAEVVLKAKKRMYPGGRDEADLKVQTPLPSPNRKMGTSNEPIEPPAQGSED